MKPIEYRKFLRDGKKLCQEHGVKLVILRGKGSHRSVIFRDMSNEDLAVSATVTEQREISPRVQREILRALRRYGVHEAVAGLAELVRQLLEDFFNGNL